MDINNVHRQQWILKSTQQALWLRHSNQPSKPYMTGALLGTCARPHYNLTDR